MYSYYYIISKEITQMLLNSLKSHLFQELEKHPDFQVTSCHQNDTTNINFAYIESE